MNFEDIIGQEELKRQLSQMLTSQKIPHALFFLGQEGYGSMALALAFSKAILADKKGCSSKKNRLDHPDFHFIAPSFLDKKNKNGVCDWRSFLEKNPYSNLFEWFDFIKIENKQAQIGVESLKSLFYLTQLKTYKGGYRIFLLWRPERLTQAAANKILKILEEPPPKTIFLLVGQNKQEILPTIKSRLQIIQVPPIERQEIYEVLINKFQLEEIQAKKTSELSEGNWKKTLEFLQNTKIKGDFEEVFISWLRSIFFLQKKKIFFKEILDISHKLASWGREKQKEFLLFSLEIIRKAFLASNQINHSGNPFFLKEFRWENFYIFIHKKNIGVIYEKLNNSIHRIEKNANSKMTFFDLSVELSENFYKI